MTNRTARAVRRMEAANHASERAQEELKAGMDSWGEATRRMSTATDLPGITRLHAEATAAGERVRLLMDASTAANREAHEAARAAVDAVFPAKPARAKEKR